jgi:hypothetical protein
MTKKMVVKALVKFSDARTGRDYRPGDVVEGWGAARAQHYAGLGLVAVEMTAKPDAGPTAQQSCAKLGLGSSSGTARSETQEDEKAGPEEVKEEEKETKPGPTVKKPAKKPSKKK